VEPIRVAGASDSHNLAVIVFRVAYHAQRLLPELSRADNPLCLFPHSAQGGQQNGQKQSNYRNDNQQLNQGETFSPVHRILNSFLAFPFDFINGILTRFNTFRDALK
jgi:hypothetical protein